MIRERVRLLRFWYRKVRCMWVIRSQQEPAHGKVRAMMDDKGRRVKEAGPSTPVEILGLSDVPNAGEIFVATENEKEARSFAETFISEG